MLTIYTSFFISQAGTEGFISFHKLIKIIIARLHLILTPNRLCNTRYSDKINIESKA